MKKAFTFKTPVAIGIIFLLALQLNVSAKDKWVKTATTKVQVVGNSSEREIRAVYENIQQLELIFTKTLKPHRVFKSTPINIILFEDENSFEVFKPVENGKRQDWVAGFFQPGEDINYIVLSSKSDLKNTKRTINHEYIHSLINNYYGQENVPPWINEGLAEYFEHTTVKTDTKFIIGNPRFGHREIKSNFSIESLDSFFKVDYKILRKRSKDEIERFYAQAWLLNHLILNGTEGNEAKKMREFLNLLLRGDSPEKAYKTIFNADLEDLESKLKNYINRKRFRTKTLEFEKGVAQQNEVKLLPVSESEAKAFQGDLLYNMNRFEEAESYLLKSLELDPKMSLALTTLGLIKMKEGRFSKAKRFLKKALEGGQENYLIHYRYAYVLSREDAEQIGYLSPFRYQKFAEMRKSLHKSMKLNPQFPESFYLMAFINLVQDVEYDESIKMLEKALEITPGNHWYLIRLSEFYFRKKELEKAESFAKQVAAETFDPVLKDYAERNLKVIEDYRDGLKYITENPENFVRSEEGFLTEAEQRKIDEKLIVEALNNMLRKPRRGEERMIGILSKIACGKKGILYQLATEDGEVNFKSSSFENLRFAIFNNILEKKEINCGSSFPDNLVIVTFQPIKDVDSEEIGKVIGIEFVPHYFKFPEPIGALNK